MTSDVETALGIRAPMLAFERIYRGTGAIRRTCLLTHRSPNPLSIRVECDFAEHSWLQIGLETPVATDTTDGIPHHGVSGIGISRNGGTTTKLCPISSPMLLPPGESRVHLLINTDSSTFPYDHFRGRLVFEESRTDRRPFVEISFERILELRDFEGWAAIDLGTSDSMISVYDPRRDAVRGMPWSPSLEEDGSEEMPSTVFVRDLRSLQHLEERSCSIGRRAIEEYQNHPDQDPRSLLKGIKSHLSQRSRIAVDARGVGGSIDPTLALSMIARRLRALSQRHPNVRSRLRHLIVTYPPTWDYRKIDRWKEVFRRLGFDDDQLDLSLDEASAAGLYHVHKWTVDPEARRSLFQDLHRSHQSSDKGDQYRLRLLSFDFGGGTIDLAHIRVDITVRETALRLRISLEGSDGLSFGGDHVTLSIFRILKRRVAMALSHPQRFRGVERKEDDHFEEAKLEASAGATSTHAMFSLPSGHGKSKALEGTGEHSLDPYWEDLASNIGQESMEPAVEDAIERVFPTRFWTSPEEPLSRNAKRNFAWLWDRAESLKRDLFGNEPRDRLEGIRSPTSLGSPAGILLGDLPDVDGATFETFMDLKIPVSVSEVDEAIRPKLMEAMSQARTLIGEEPVDRVVLTGHSCRIPLVTRLFMQTPSEGGFGLPLSKIEFDAPNAKAAVSKGACLYQIMRHSMVGYDVDISRFRARLFADLYYRAPLGQRRTLFRCGAIDILNPYEDRPDPDGFVEYLTVFESSSEQPLGHFDFRAPGDAISCHREASVETARALNLEGDFPRHSDMDSYRERSPEGADRLMAHMRRWPDKAAIAWVEASADQGTDRRPIFRYYLSENRNLYAVRAQGPGRRELFTLHAHADESESSHGDPRFDPFSGRH